MWSLLKLSERYRCECGRSLQTAGTFARAVDVRGPPDDASLSQTCRSRPARGGSDPSSVRDGIESVRQEDSSQGLK